MLIMIIDLLWQWLQSYGIICLLNTKLGKRQTLIILRNYLEHFYSKELFQTYTSGLIRLYFKLSFILIVFVNLLLF